MSEIDIVQRTRDGSQLPETICPSCGTNLDAATPIDVDVNNRPAPGAYAVCHCGSLLVFNEDYTLRLLTMDEVAAMKDSDRNELIRARRILASAFKVARK
jgi:hypothetical protein